MSLDQQPLQFNLADIFEMAVDAFADREMLAVDGKRATFAEIEAKANRLAHHLAGTGVGAGDHVGIYAYNCEEWVLTMLAAIKLRAVWININYRYVANELKYLFDNSDIKALVVQRQFVPLVADIRDQLSPLCHCLVIEDGNPIDDSAGLVDAEFLSASAVQSPERDFSPRSGDDRYILFTGGSTGMPKGVVWRQEDVFFALGGGIDAMTGERVKSPDEIVNKSRTQPQSSFMNCAPLMHGASQWGVLNGAYNGRKTLLTAKFWAQSVWDTLAGEKVNGLMITGDAMGRPLIEAYQARPQHWDCSELFILTSTAAIFSPSVKAKFVEHFPQLLIIDGVGASETGSTGMTLVTADDYGNSKGGLTIKAGPDTAVLDEDLQPLPPGSEQIGKLARCGNIPLGYYRDPQKTAEVFVTAANGHRYAMPGDYARHEADGRITLLGRGSATINSGGMKIFPEEVEQVIKGHPEVFDVLVVGLPDQRWGSTVTAVVQPRENYTPELSTIQDYCRQYLAGFKIPRKLLLTDSIVRSPAGKPDYPWAERYARDQNRLDRK